MIAGTGNAVVHPCLALKNPLNSRWSKDKEVGLQHPMIHNQIWSIVVVYGSCNPSIIIFYFNSSISARMEVIKTFCFLFAFSKLYRDSWRLPHFLGLWHSTPFPTGCYNYSSNYSLPETLPWPSLGEAEAPWHPTKWSPGTAAPWDSFPAGKHRWRFKRY